MIALKSPEEIEILREANQIVARVMQRLAEMIHPGVETIVLDREAERMIAAAGGLPAFKGYRGFRHTLCVSVNEELVHGIPSARRLKEGDIVSIDCGVFYRGFCGDHAWTFPVGHVSEKARNIMRAGEKALALAIEKMRVEKRLFDISAAVQEFAEGEGYSVVRDFVGHGIGKELHEEPQLPNFGTAGTGMRLKAGLVLACEPMINEGTPDVRTLDDGWTVVTADGRLSVHFEHSVAITEKGPDILSRWKENDG